jgi:hypothetical protein
MQLRLTARRRKKSPVRHRNREEGPQRGLNREAARRLNGLAMGMQLTAMRRVQL